MEALDELRPFVTNRHTTLKWRREQLEILRETLVLEKDAMCKALSADLCVDYEQATVLQIGSVFAEIDCFLEGMDEWSAPQDVPTPLALMPAKSYIQCQPKGVVLILGAWNYPFNVTIGPAMAALAAGNCIVVKPSEIAPESAKVMEKIFGRLDKRAVRCVNGGPELSAGLTSQPFDHIMYTGGPRVAKLVLASAAPNLTPVTLELGGKSPVVMAKGTNLVEACKRIITHKFTNTGQTCIAPDYVLVERQIRDEVATLLTNNVKSVFGDKPEAANHFGRMVHKGAADRLLSFLQEDHGGRVLIGGSTPITVPESPAREMSRYVPPTLVLDPRKDSKLLEEEIFGPILPILTVDSCEEAVAHINSRPKPLALYVFAPKKVTQAVIEGTSSGGVVIGDAIVHKGNPDLPFGGIGNSGTGRVHGKYGFREFSNERAIMNRPLAIPSPLVLPIHKTLASVAWTYATVRPLHAIKRYYWKLCLALLAALAFSVKRLRM